MDEPDDDDELIALTAGQLAQIKEWVDKGTFEVELEDDDLVLSVECRLDEDMASGFMTVERLARISLRSVVASFVSRADDAPPDGCDTRTRLLAMAGRLRECARFIEQEADDLNNADWERNTVPRLLIVEDEQGGGEEGGAKDFGQAPIG